MIELKLDETYDPYDMMHMTIPDEFEYAYTVEIEQGIYIDFDADGRSVSIELIRASKQFKLLTKNFKIGKKEGVIKITDESIQFEMHIHFMDRLMSIEHVIGNDFGLKNGEYSFSNY